MAKKPAAAVYADKIFQACLYEFELRQVTDRTVRAFLGLTVGKYAAGKRYLRLHPEARLGFSYTSNSDGFRLTTSPWRIAAHEREVRATTAARLEHLADEVRRVQQ